MDTLFSDSYSNINNRGYKRYRRGIILKPVLDGLNILSVTAISFLSSCTVLSMSLVAIIRNIRKEIKISVIVSGYLALGSCIGGVAGKVLLNTVISLWGRKYPWPYSASDFIRH